MIHQILNVTSHYRRVRDLYFRYERLLMPATLLVGFLLDYVTFTNIQINITFTLLTIYWALAGITIAFLALTTPETLPAPFRYLRLFAPLYLQFAFGALLSTSLIFYWFSGAFAVSWPIIGLIAILMVSNDVFREYFRKPLLQISVYFFTTFSLLSVTFPFIFNSLSTWLFVAAGLTSLAIFGAYIYMLGKKAPYIWQQRYHIATAIMGIATSMYVLYATDILPPIPLALREAQLMHSIAITNGTYHMKAEPETIWQKLFPGQVLHVAPGETVYLYTAIFAPAKLQTTIVHHWQYYDPQQEAWLDRGRLLFNIVGGRQEGYKGYSFTSNLQAGKWRVHVENERGQVLGRIPFTVNLVTEPVPLQEIIR